MLILQQAIEIKESVFFKNTGKQRKEDTFWIFRKDKGDYG